MVGTRRADFIIEDKVVVELKAVVNLEDVHLAQAKNYTVAYDFPLGLLINFGAQSLQHKLLFNPKYHPKSNSVNPKSSKS
jgi:GxxExxY protein